MKLRQRICTRWDTVQHQTKVFYFVVLKFAGLPDQQILTNHALTLWYSKFKWYRWSGFAQWILGLHKKMEPMSKQPDPKNYIRRLLVNSPIEYLVGIIYTSKNFVVVDIFRMVHPSVLSRYKYSWLTLYKSMVL
jgi:hypothetical protein